MEQQDKRAEQEFVKNKDWYEVERGIYLRKLINNIEQLYD